MNDSNSTGSINSNQFIERICVSAIGCMIGILGVFGNILLLALFHKNPQLRKHSRYLQIVLAIGDAVFCFGQIVNGATTLLIVNLSLSIVRWKCRLLSICVEIGHVYTLVITVFMALDRSYAIVQPMKYRLIPKFWLCASCAWASLLIGLIFLVITWTDVDLFDYPDGCLAAYSRSPRMSGMIQNFNTAAGVLLLIIYPITLLIMKFETKRHLKSNHDLKQIFMKQVEVTASITCIILASLVLYFIPNILLIVFKSLAVLPLITSKAPPYIGVLSGIHSCVNCAFYVWKDKKMQQVIRGMMKGVRVSVMLVSKVGPAPLVHPGDKRLRNFLVKENTPVTAF